MYSENDSSSAVDDELEPVRKHHRANGESASEYENLDSSIES